MREHTIKKLLAGAAVVAAVGLTGGSADAAQVAHGTLDQAQRICREHGGQESSVNGDFLCVLPDGSWLWCVPAGPLGVVKCVFIEGSPTPPAGGQVTTSTPSTEQAPEAPTVDEDAGVDTTVPADPPVLDPVDPPADDPTTTSTTTDQRTTGQFGWTAFR